MFDRKLIKHKGISKEQWKEFQEVVKKQITIVKLSKFKNFILFTFNIFLIIILFGLAPLVLFLFISAAPGIKGSGSIFLMLIAIALGPILAIIDIKMVSKYNK